MKSLRASTVGILALHFASGSAMPQVVVTPVVLSGSPSPAGGTYGSVSGAGSAVFINAAGQVEFSANVTGGSSTGGRFAGAPGSIQAVALVGEAAPAGGNYSVLGGPAPLNVAGQVAFQASLTGGSSTLGIFVGAPGSLQAAALQGTAAPAGGSYNVLNVPVLDDSGRVAFHATLTGGSATEGIFAGAPGAVQAVALQGNAAPAGGNYSSFGFPVISTSGQLAFNANLTGGSAASGIFAGATGSVQTVALQGNAAPAGGNYSSLSGPVINASGQVAFPANLTGGSATNGIFAGTVGALQPIALQGSAAPAGGIYSTLSGPALNASGQLAFFATLTGGSSTQGIFSGTSGSLQTDALQGLLAPGGNGAIYSSLLGPTLFNDVGEVVFSANLSGTGVVPSNNLGLYAGLPGGVVEIVRKGDAIDFGNGSGLHTVSNIFAAGGVLNNSGDIVYSLAFTDGTTGIFTSTIPVPEPSTLALTSVALTGIWFRRRLAHRQRG